MKIVKTKFPVLLRLLLPLAAALLLALPGCNSASDMRTQSQQAAKNWSSVIRGAQVFPLNPLREDLEPGDVFLVTQTIEAQSDAYDSKGYLPLDQQLCRLSVNATSTPDAPPMAGLPSFSFTVDRASGAQVNFPVDGIPIGLGLTGGSKAAVSLAISNATSRVVYIADLHPAVEGWCRRESTLLRRIRMVTRGPLLLRVVSRVYYTQAVTASITGIDSAGASVAVGGGAFETNGTMLSLLTNTLTSTNGTERFEALAGELGKIKPLEVQLPGGKASYMRSSSNIISMQQSFRRPLAVGYTGFDVYIDENGAAGPPMGSAENLEDLYRAPMESADFGACILVDRYVATLPLERRRAVCIEMAKDLKLDKAAKGLAKAGDQQALDKALDAFWSDVSDYFARGDIDTTQKRDALNQMLQRATKEAKR